MEVEEGLSEEPSEQLNDIATAAAAAVQRDAAEASRERSRLMKWMRTKKKEFAKQLLTKVSYGDLRNVEHTIYVKVRVDGAGTSITYFCPFAERLSSLRGGRTGRKKSLTTV